MVTSFYSCFTVNKKPVASSHRFNTQLWKTIDVLSTFDKHKSFAYEQITLSKTNIFEHQNQYPIMQTISN